MLDQLHSHTRPMIRARYKVNRRLCIRLGTCEKHARERLVTPSCELDILTVERHRSKFR